MLKQLCVIGALQGVASVAFAGEALVAMDGCAYGEVFAPVLEKHVKSLRARGVNCAGFYNGYRRARMKGGAE